MARYINAELLEASLKESAAKCLDWIDRAETEEDKRIREQAYVTFTECILRVKDTPTVDIPDVCEVRAKSYQYGYNNGYYRGYYKGYFKGSRPQTNKTKEDQNNENSRRRSFLCKRAEGTQLD